MATTDKTIVKTDKGNHIVVYECANGKGGYRHKTVKRKSRREQLKCRHSWKGIVFAFRGHGNWGRGCSKCGALGRGPA